VKLTNHLLPALLAVLLIAAVLGGGVLYAQSVESRYVHALAPRLLRHNLFGSALQRQALRQPDLLPVYGSSEVSDEVAGYMARDFFSTYPTGFAPFDVAIGGRTSLTMAEGIAALGPDLRGKKVIISFTPTMFFVKSVTAGEYAGLFSRLHANELAFSTQLSLATKQAAARRMLDFPTTLDKEPLLSFALRRLAGGSPLDLGLYYAVWPLGKLWTSILELQDHWEVLTSIWANPGLNPDVPRVPAAVDWTALAARAEQEQMAATTNNPYGIDDDTWNTYVNKAPKRYASRDSAALQRLGQSAEWTDFDILLRVLTDMGAQPLILSRPANLTYWEAMGVSPAVSRAYYDKLHQATDGYAVPAADFHEYDQDKYFSSDAASHTSRKGWVYINKAMDDFYHGVLPQ
jgi:D-alanine transfer protein